MIAARALSRILRPGCRSGFARNCAKISGEAFTSTHESPPVTSPQVTAMEDWVRAWARKVPVRYPLQLGQLQFHWGKPPPAADPRTRIRTYGAGPQKLNERPRLSAIRHVHGDFHAEPNLDRLWGFPFHDLSPRVEE